MAVRLRESLAALPGYVPGRAVPGAVKLASNESALGPLPYVVDRVAQVAAQANRYPDNQSAELVDELGRRYRLPPAQVVVGAGSVSLCQQLVLATAEPGQQVVHGWRSFEAYPIVIAVGGAAARPVPLLDHRHDLPAMAAAVTDTTRLIFVCNPNNPTGTVVGRAELTAFLHRVPDEVVVVLDEAYHEFVTDPDVPDGRELLADHPNLVVLRTFSKAYGLAGLRVGYALCGDSAVAAALRQVQVPFAVSGMAQQAAIASLEPAAGQQLAARVAETVTERERVRSVLLASGFEVPPTQANFVWLALGTDAVEFAAHCEKHRVIVRAFANSGVRVTISTARENDQFLAAVAAR